MEFEEAMMARAAAQGDGRARQWLAELDERSGAGSVEFLERRVRDLEQARDRQADEIRKLRARGAVMLTVGEHTVYGTSVAVNAIRSLLSR